MSTDDGPGTREVAHRLFAAEFEDANFQYSESDEERAPNYVVTPTGARVNRLFTVGVLTEVETVNENTLRGRIVDPTGAFVTYAGQYQPDEVAFLDRTSPPTFVSLTGKARTFQPEDSEIVYTSVRPERFNEVDADTRDRWSVSAAQATLRRVAVTSHALDVTERGDELRDRLVSEGISPSLASGVALAIDHYDTGERYLEAVRQLAVQTLEVVAGERDEVESLTTDPDARGSVSLGPLPEGVPTFDTAAAGSADDELAAAAGGEGETSEPGQPAPTAGGGSTAEGASAGGGDSPSEGADTTTDDDIGSFDTGDVADSFDDTDESLDVDESLDPEADAGTDDELGGFDTNELDTGADDPATGTDDPATETDDPTTETDEFDAGTDDTESDTDEFDAGTDDTEPGTDDIGSGTDGLDTGTDDFDADTSEPATSDADAGLDEDELESFDPESDDALTEEEREQVESEFDVGFSAGSEVPDPEESDLDAPDPEEITPDPDATDATGTATSNSDTGDTTAEPAESAGDDTDDDQSADDVDLTTAVVDVMGELDDGDGADREEVLAATVDRYGADPGAVEDAIQDALMSGQCYEASDGLKPI